jgi:ferredoxin--NADP+ reductase
MVPIVHKRQLSDAVFEMGVLAPDAAKAAQAGQFLIIRIDESGERVPFTFTDWDAETGVVTFTFMAVGKTTRKLASLQVGDELADFVGPLGTPTHVEGLGRVAVVGGGVGTAVAYPVARAMCEAGNEVTVIMGARNADLLILEDEFRALPIKELVIVTDDGSAGRKGLVTAPLAEMGAAGSLDHAFAVGPAIMMKFCAATCVEHDVPVTVSLNPIMLDGTGMCGACRVTIGDEVKFACVDGPDFDGALVDFSELMNRQRTYVDAEREADAEYQRECACPTR